MRQQRVSPSRRNRKFKYAFEASIDEVQINVKFPCRIAVSWNYGQGQVRTSASKPLVNGIAKFDQKLTFNTTVGFDQDSQRYAQQRTTIEISIITDNGTSLAGFVPIDLGAVINKKDRKELYEIERCPDKKACLRIRISHRFLNDRPSKNKVRLLGHHSEDSEFEDGNRSITPRSEYMPKTEIVKKAIKVDYNRQTPQLNKNRQLIEKQLLILKGRVTEFETKFKNQRIQKQKIAELLKGKQQIFFTMKTQIKRKQIQVQDIYRSLQQYRSQYQRIKIIDQNNRKDSDKTIKALQTNQRLLNDKISKLQTQLTTFDRKAQKFSFQNQKLKKQKDSLLVIIKDKTQESHKEKQSLNQAIRVLKKQKQQQGKNSRLQKETLERNIRQLTKANRQLSDELEATKLKLSGTEKKLSKSQQTRTEQFQKFNLRVAELDKLRESLIIECEALKNNLTKKQSMWTESMKSYEGRLGQEKNVLGSTKTQLTEVQLERATLQKDLALVKEAARSADEDNKRLQKQNAALRGQISALTQQLQARNLQIRSLSTKIKDLQEQILRQQAQLQQTHEQTVTDLNTKLKQLKKAEQNKNANTMKQLAKKQKQLQETLQREHKLNIQLQGLKDQYKKSDAVNKQKIEAGRKTQTTLRMEIQQMVKKLQKSQQDAASKYQSLSRHLVSVQQNLAQHRQMLQKSTERQHKLRQQVQSLSQKMIYFEQNKQLLAEYENKLKQYDRKVDELSDEIHTRQLKQINFGKQIADLKQKLIQTDTDRNKKDGMLREKQKQLGGSVKQAALESEERKKDQNRRQAELKQVQDELRQTVRKDRLKQDQLTLQNQRLNNQLAIAQATIQQTNKAIQQLQLDIRNYRDNQRSLHLEKQQLLRKRQQGQIYRRDLQQLRITTQQNLSYRDKQSRHLKHQLAELQRAHSDLNKNYTRNNMLGEELLQIAIRINSITAGYTSSIKQSSVMGKSINSGYQGSEYDKLLELRKTLVVAEGKWKKELEVANEKQHMRAKEKERDIADIQKLNADGQRLKAELQRFKKENQELTYSNDFLKIENQELMYRIEGLQTDLSNVKSTNIILESKTKQLGSEAERGEQQSKQLQTRYQALLQQTRTTLGEKAQKLKKQQAAIIRKLQTRIEELEQKNFQLQLQSQKAGQLAKRQQENKKVLSKAYEVERQNQQQLQATIQKHQKAQRQIQKLLWDKKNLQDALTATNTKLERQTAQIQQELDKANIRLKQFAQQIRDKQVLIAKTQQAYNRLNFQNNSLKASIQQQRDKWTSTEAKLRTQSAKFKSDYLQYKKQCQQQREQLLAMEGIKMVRNTLQQQLQARQKALSIIQEKDQRQSQQVFRLTQKLQQAKWQFQMKLEAKQSQIISMQQHLYAMNSKQNLRILKQNQTYQRIKQLQSEKKTVVRQLQDIKQKYYEAEEINRQLFTQKRQIDELARNPRRDDKYDQVLKSFEREITSLRQQNESLKVRNTLPY